jgi:hypothetical protein
MTMKWFYFGSRIIKNGPLSPRFLFFYDPNGQLIGEYRDDASTTTPVDDWLVRQETVWLGNIPVAVITKPAAASEIQVHYIHADHLNTPRLIVDTNDTIVWRWDNTHAFGANLPNEDPDGNGQFEIELIVLVLFGKSMRKQVILMNIQILECFQIIRVLSLFLIISLSRVM